MPPVVLVDAENVRRSRWPNVRGVELVERSRAWAEREGLEVEVVFEPAHGSADDVIAQRARELHEAGAEVWVVTSDRDLRARAAAHAVRTIGGGAFLELLAAG